MENLQLKSFVLKKYGRMYIQLGIMAVFSSLIFFVITNFAVWLVWDFYPKTFDGLILCYVAGLPFLRNTLMSTILYTGFFVLLIDVLRNSSVGLKLRKV